MGHSGRKFPAMNMLPAIYRYRALLLGLSLCAASTVGAAAIQSWTDDEGVIHYSNVPRAAAERDAGRVALTPTAQAAARRAIYKYRDDAGVIHYTNRQPVGENFIVVRTYCPACDPHSTLNWDTVRLHSEDFHAEIASAAQRWQVDPALVRAVIHAESAFNPEAISRAGAQGLMQLMPATAGDYGVTNAFDVHQNINAGTRLLADLLVRYRGNTELATAAYNAGPGAVKQYGGVPPFAETQVYVKRVATLHRRYQDQS